MTQSGKGPSARIQPGRNAGEGIPPDPKGTESSAEATVARPPLTWGLRVLVFVWAGAFGLLLLYELAQLIAKALP
jgi:hypothetical protein